jgi:predicted nuclease of predicted toxin-antitoxin system
MNLSPLWVAFFASEGLEAIHWSSVGSRSAPDDEIMEFAAAGEYIVFTHDLDFGTLLAATQRNSPSVIQVRCHDVLPDAIGGLVMRSIGVAKSYLEEGALLTVDSERQRIRLLPI